MRFNSGMTGYSIYWFNDWWGPVMRLTRWEHGSEYILQESNLLTSPPQQWLVQVQGDVIRFFGDGVLILEVTDTTYRSGYFGFWAYSNGTRIEVNNIRIGSKFRALIAK